MNFPTLVIAAILVVLIILAVRHLMKNGSCGCDCGGDCDCSGGSSCCCGTEINVDEINKRISEAEESK